MSTPESKILVVEDQDDVRRLLVTALEMEGHEVTEASSADEGLSCLRQAKYNLILSDYAMPGGTGTWMLQEADRQGLLGNAVAMIVTAHPGVRAVAGVEVVNKPLDLDSFLAQVNRLLTGAAGPAGGPRGGGGPRRRADPTHKVEFVLYVSAASAVAVQARRNFERILNGFDTSQVKFTVCDLMANPRAGEEDRIAFTPTLVKRFPEPRMWVIGNLKDPGIVVDLLKASGVDSRE